MAFELPKLVDLTDDQLTILNAPYSDNMIVSGAPGTGKSVLAIYRAADLANSGKKALLLVYNRPLRQYISSAVNSLHISTEVSTYYSWLRDIYKTQLHKPVPCNHFEWNWDMVTADFKTLGTLYDNILIDEAQDFPLELINALTYVGKYVNCFMDVDQRIFSKRYTRYQDVAAVLGIEAMYTLSENFRNTEEIFDFAKIYNDNDCNNITTIRNGEKPLFLHVDSEAEQIDTIATIIQNNSTSTIGVFTNYNEQEDTANIIKDHVSSKIQVCAYDSKSKNKELWTVDFDHSGVFVLSTGTMKGLEFDIVIIPNVDKLYGKNDSMINANTFYVAATRASEELYCFYTSRNKSNSCIDVFGPLSENEDLVDWE